MFLQTSITAFQLMFSIGIFAHEMRIKASKVSNFKLVRRWLLIRFCLEKLLSHIALLIRITITLLHKLLKPGQLIWSCPWTSPCSSSTSWILCGEPLTEDFDNYGNSFTPSLKFWEEEALNTWRISLAVHLSSVWVHQTLLKDITARHIKTLQSPLIWNIKTLIMWLNTNLDSMFISNSSIQYLINTWEIRYRENVLTTKRKTWICVRAGGGSAELELYWRESDELELCLRGSN
jgi:hypothetical protein